MSAANPIALPLASSSANHHQPPDDGAVCRLARRSSRGTPDIGRIDADEVLESKALVDVGAIAGEGPNAAIEIAPVPAFQADAIPGKDRAALRHRQKIIEEHLLAFRVSPMGPIADRVPRQFAAHQRNFRPAETIGDIERILQNISEEEAG